MDELLTLPLQKTTPPRPRRAKPLVERIARWSIRHRKTAVLGWLALVGAAILAGQLMGTQSVPQYDPGQAGHGEQILHELNVTSPPAESVLIQARAPAAAVRDPGVLHQLRRAVDQVAAALDGMPRAAEDVTSTSLPGGAPSGGGGLVSAAGRSALITFKVAGPESDADSTVAADMQVVARIQARFPALLVSEAGSASADAAGNALLESDFRKTELTSVPITLILLVAVFGALIAAGIPVLLAGTAVTAAVSLLAIPSRWLPIGSGTAEMVLIIGMAVGVDYSLFYLRREREERAAGHNDADALHIAAATSGRSIVVSGLTVMISMAGLFLTGIDAFTGMAWGTITVVGVAVLGSLTLLPALLSMLGPWADRWRIPILGRRRTAAGPSRLWAALVRRVVVHPVAWGLAAVVALLVLAAPALGMRVGNPQVDLPANLPIVQTMDKISLAFPGRPAPAEVVVTGQDVTGPAASRAVEALAARASASGPINGPVTAHAVAAGRGLIISVPLAGSGLDAVSNHALQTLRNQILPSTLGRVSGVSFAVTGDTAVNHDWSAVLHARSPIVFVVVAMLAFGVLALAFRSVVLPLVSIVLNLLSLGAAYGLITLIFQDGHLQGPLGFTSYGAIAQWVPLFMFVFLFGLSMDYHVFILSRIRERWQGGASTSEAVVGGISSSAGVVTSAAVIMVAVFSIFATLSFVDVKTLGVGLAFAVLIDATVVRGILVPAAMTLLGERSWYLPGWLNWLPGGGHQPSQQVSSQPAGQ
jgi:RND superfamily putative drug exporter